MYAVAPGGLERGPHGRLSAPGRLWKDVPVIAGYRPLFSVPGARQFILGATISRVGGAMFGVGVIVMISSRRDSYALAGAVSAVGVLVLAIAAPILGRLIDKYGQARIAGPAIAICSLATFFTVWVSWTGAPTWMLFLGYGFSAMLPEVGPMSRARWAHLFKDAPEKLHSAMSLEQVLEELAFVVGPVVAVVAATTLFPEAGLVLAQLFFAGGALLFLAERTTEPTVTPHDERPAGLAIQRPGMLILAATLFMVGVLFGANEVVAVAVADEGGSKAFSSTILAAFALGSAISGLLFGARQLSTRIVRRFVLLGAAMCLLQAPVLLTDNLWGLTAIMFIAGSATAPMLITALTLAQRLVPPALLTEGMAVAVTGILVGISAGTSVGGVLIEHLGAHPAYALPDAAAAIAALLSYAGRSRIRLGLRREASRA